MSTTCNPYFTELRKKWYPIKEKIVPPDLKLNPEILSWWFCDDGHKYVDKNLARIYIQGFNIESNELLVVG